MSNRLDQEREKTLQPKRMQWAINEITDRGYEVFNQTDTFLQFVFKGSLVTLYVYSGWHTGKSIKDGRGLENLLRQIEQDKII